MNHVAFAIVNKHGRVVEQWLRRPTRRIAAQWDGYKESRDNAPHRVVKLFAKDSDKVKLWTPTTTEGDADD